MKNNIFIFMNAIEIKNLTKSYGKARRIIDINFKGDYSC